VHERAPQAIAGMWSMRAPRVGPCLLATSSLQVLFSVTHLLRPARRVSSTPIGEFRRRHISGRQTPAAPRGLILRSLAAIFLAERIGPRSSRGFVAFPPPGGALTVSAAWRPRGVSPSAACFLGPRYCPRRRISSSAWRAHPHSGTGSAIEIHVRG